MGKDRGAQSGRAGEGGGFWDGVGGGDGGGCEECEGGRGGGGGGVVWGVWWVTPDDVHAQPPSANFSTGYGVFEFRFFAGMFFFRFSFFVFVLSTSTVFFGSALTKYSQGMHKDSALTAATMTP